MRKILTTCGMLIFTFDDNELMAMN